MQPGHQTIIPNYLLILALIVPGMATASNGGAASPWFWNFFIAVIVLATTGASAALPLAAIRQWRGFWRGAALLPMLVLFAWIALIVIERFLDASSHRLWPFELFAWAMLNMIYMVALMTCKRILEKADKEKVSST